MGARKNKSVIDTIILLIHKIQRRQKKGEKAAALFIDIKNVFDHVSKKKLTERIINLNIDKNLIGQTQSFIIKKNRTYNRRAYKLKNNNKY